MKKAVCFIYIFIFLFAAIGCTKSFYYNYDTLKEEIEKIEIINIYPYEGNLYPYKEKEIELIKTLIEDEKDEFLLDLSKIQFTIFYGSPNYSPMNKCLMLYYKDGTKGFMNHYTFFKFNKEETECISSKNSHASEEEFNKLFLKFI